MPRHNLDPSPASDRNNRQPASSAFESNEQALGDAAMLGVGNNSVVKQGLFANRVYALQRTIGNQAILRMLNRVSATVPDHLQRQSVLPDAGTQPDNAQSEELKKFLGTRFSLPNFAPNAKRPEDIATSPAFDLDYFPTGKDNPNPDIRPISGDVVIKLKIHVTFKDFDKNLKDADGKQPYKNIRFTPQQKEKFAWSDEEKVSFTEGIKTQMMEGWRQKHRMLCKSPGFEELSAGVDVQVETVEDAAQAHNRMTALKIPDDLPRFRSFVDGRESTLEFRDSSGTEDSQVLVPKILRPIGPFEKGHDDLSGDLTGQVDEVINETKNLLPPDQQATGLTSDWTMFYVGRSSSSGSKVFNQKLAERRATTVRDYIKGQTGWSNKEKLKGAGEKDTTDEARFQRVNVAAVPDSEKAQTASQNTAAHEAGHMFGLGDEYVDEEAHRLPADQARHHKDVQDELDKTEANKTLVGRNKSIMSQGNEVAAGHYVYFLKGLEKATGKEWTVQ